MASADYSTAFEQWRRLLPNERVLSETQATESFSPSTSARRRRIAGALRPQNTTEISQIVKIAQAHGVPLYTISTGHNWGYGTALPPVDDCIIVDLSGMDKVVAFDADLGTVTVQPGVTQKILRDFLDQKNASFLVPVHGGGPKCSLIGNALERGFGITPHADHFSAVLSLEAVLPNGQVYRSPLHELGTPETARIFKWGVGPYLDGLFTQSNFGIVTEMTIALARRPERVEGFYFWIAEDKDLEKAVTAVRRIIQKLGSAVGAVNLLDQRRQISMVSPYPTTQIAPGAIMPEDLVRTLGRQNDLPAWLGLGTLYGDARMVKAARSIIRQSLKEASSRVLFLNPAFAERLWRLLRRLPFIKNRGRVQTLPKLIEGLKIACGIPSEVALHLTTWKSKQPPTSNESIDPSKDGNGLIWYTPLIPMRAEDVRAHVDLLRSTCQKFGIEPLITLTSLSERCFDSSVPILFDKSDAAEAQRAEQCYRELFAAGRRLGYVPYRYGSDHMDLLGDSASPFWNMVSQLKSALDPANILSPGRYTPKQR